MICPPQGPLFFRPPTWPPVRPLGRSVARPPASRPSSHCYTTCFNISRQRPPHRMLRAVSLRRGSRCHPKICSIPREVQYLLGPLHSGPSNAVPPKTHFFTFCKKHWNQIAQGKKLPSGRAPRGPPSFNNISRIPGSGEVGGYAHFDGCRREVPDLFPHCTVGG